ncbi:MAG: hypothetical protein LUD55_07775 [Oscillospiraceae bacterium]|nr:hypothetical protein [Oscillospiraceae bacterium]
MDGKISASENRMMAYFESEIMPKFNILAEEQQMIWDKMAYGDRVDKLEEDVFFLQTVSRIHGEQIAEVEIYLIAESGTVLDTPVPVVVDFVSELSAAVNMPTDLILPNYRPCRFWHGRQ